MKKMFILFVTIMFLTACGMTKEDLGMARSKPDESQVSSRAKLVVPPDYGVRP
ncbi:MAG: DUF3035 domain-containing protein [Acetobacter sp.]|nr:DUF3035 domain-containing protein [Acetobacter sp.]